jgi:hypothetical protein
MKYTVKVLRETIADYNGYQVASGSNILFDFVPHNGHQGIDLVYIDEQGNKLTIECYELGTSKECIMKLYNSAQNYLGVIHRFTSVSRKMAKAVLSHVINFNLDCSRLNNSQIQDLIVWRKLTKYNHRPLNYGRSIGFYLHLKNKVDLS